MIRRSLSHIRWVWLASVASTAGLLLILSRCEQNPIITELPGSRWEISDTSYSVDNTVFIRTPGHGSSLTLYAGPIDEQDREAGILIKFPSVDTSQFSNLKAATLFLFRRTFADEPPEHEADFTLYVVETPGGESDTIWAESDTGLTLADFLDTTSHATVPMIAATATVFVGGVDSDSVLEHLAFPIDTLLLRQWAEGSKANNGFLLRRENPGTLVGFHSSDIYDLSYSHDLSPYLVLTFTNTTDAKYSWPAGDLSIYDASQPDNFEGLLHLNHSSGVRSHIDFPNPDTTSIITGGRLTLYLNDEVEVSPIVADQVDIQVLRRARPLAQGDSTEVLISRVIYQGASNSLVLKLGGFLSGVATGAYKNYGLDLVVIPNNHDFDHLVFWGSSAPDGLKPCLDVVYGSPYTEVP